MTGIWLASVAIGLVKLADIINATADRLARRDDLNIPVSPPPGIRAAEALAGRSALLSYPSEQLTRGRP